jgi:hypothetical protein
LLSGRGIGREKEVGVNRRGICLGLFEFVWGGGLRFGEGDVKMCSVAASWRLDGKEI